MSAPVREQLKTALLGWNRAYGNDPQLSLLRTTVRSRLVTLQNRTGYLLARLDLSLTKAHYQHWRLTILMMACRRLPPSRAKASTWMMQPLVRPLQTPPPSAPPSARRRTTWPRPLPPPSPKPAARRPHAAARHPTRRWQRLPAVGLALAARSLP